MPISVIDVEISIIVAMDKKETIGRNGGMPWDIPEDTNRFRELTLEKPIIMGRRTHESIGKRLPKRHNIIMTHQNSYEANGCTIVNTMMEALNAAEKSLDEDNEVMIIGGASVYDQFLPLAKRIYLTEIHEVFSGDREFSFDRKKWKEVERIDKLDENPPYSFVELKRK